MNDLRQLLRNPGFTAATVLLLALVTASRAGTNDSVGPARRLAAVGQPLELPATAHVVPMRGVEPRGDRADLAPLRAIVGDARVVAVGEPAHGVHEPLAFRNHLLEYLVEELRFTAIAVESAFPESRPLADYVAGGPGTVEAVVGENRVWWPKPLEKNVQLVLWLRAYNAGPGRRRPVRFYAIDLS